MKRMLLLLAFVLSLFVAAPVAAHHAASGIVSDDIWNMVDDLLADSPHLDLDLDSIMTDSMVISTMTVPTELVTEILMGIADYNRGNLVVTATDLNDGTTQIVITETIGAGESQNVSPPM